MMTTEDVRRVMAADEHDTDDDPGEWRVIADGHDDDDPGEWLVRDLGEWSIWKSLTADCVTWTIVPGAANEHPTMPPHEEGATHKLVAVLHDVTWQHAKAVSEVLRIGDAS